MLPFLCFAILIDFSILFFYLRYKYLVFLYRIYIILKKIKHDMIFIGLFDAYFLNIMPQFEGQCGTAFTIYGCF